jgi:hypothetical protein
MFREYFENYHNIQNDAEFTNMNNLYIKFHSTRFPVSDMYHTLRLEETSNLRLASECIIFNASLCNETRIHSMICQFEIFIQ